VRDREWPYCSVRHAVRIRDYLASRYDFTRPLAVEDISDDVQRMLRKWQVHVTHPRYLGLFNPSVTQASVVGDTLTSVRLAS